MNDQDSLEQNGDQSRGHHGNDLHGKNMNGPEDQHGQGNPCDEDQYGGHDQQHHQPDGKCPENAAMGASWPTQRLMRLIPGNFDGEEDDGGSFFDHAAHLAGQGFGELESTGQNFLHDLDHPIEHLQEDAEGLYDDFEDGEDEDGEDEEQHEHQQGGYGESWQ
jgi:hypothetical protein